MSLHGGCNEVCPGNLDAAFARLPLAIILGQQHDFDTVKDCDARRNLLEGSSKVSYMLA